MIQVHKPFSALTMLLRIITGSVAKRTWIKSGSLFKRRYAHGITRVLEINRFTHPMQNITRIVSRLEVSNADTCASTENSTPLCQINNLYQYLVWAYPLLLCCWLELHISIHAPPILVNPFNTCNHSPHSSRILRDRLCASSPFCLSCRIPLWCSQRP
jgi:hypothetical protein